jgi:gliding motility-associated-like protein
MKNLLLTLLFIFIGTLSAKATHLMGGEITYKHISGDTYEVTLVVYRDCSGIDVGNTASIDFSSSCGNFTETFDLDSTIEVSQLCPSDLNNSTCNGGTLPGTQKWVFSGVVTLTPCSDWVISWTDGSRNPAITNLVNPDIENIYVEATLNNIIGTYNNSPQYLALPTPYLCANQLNIFNHGASDIDGDSLYYQFAQPLSAAGNTINFAAGYTINDPIVTTAGMNLNPETGEMCFTPSQAQICVVSVLVSEYRNNILIGTQIREMQVVVSASCNGNSAPTAGGVAATCGGSGGLVIDYQGPSVTQTDANSFVMCPDDSLCFTIPFSDIDGDNVVVTTNLGTSIPSSNYSINGNGTQNASLSFCWTPTPLDSGINVITVQVQDDACPISAIQYYTYDITIFDQPYAGEDQIICGTQTANLQALGGGGYVWSVISGDTDLSHLSCTNCDNTIADPDITTTYLLTSTLAAACENTDTVTVFVVPDFNAEAIGDTILCDYLTKQLEVNITGPVGTYSFLWDNSSTLSNDTISNPIASPTQSTNYIVQVTSPDGCVKKEDTVYIQVFPPPIVTLMPGDVTVCQGETVDFDVNSECNYTLQMSDPGFGDGWNGQSLDVYENGILVGNYTVLGTDNNGDSLTVNFPLTNGSNIVLVYNTGSFQSESAFNLIDGSGTIVSSYPEGSMSGLNQGDTLYNGMVNCGGSFTDVTFSWNPASNLSNPLLANPILTSDSTRTYTVTIADTATGCSFDRDQTITVVPNYSLISTQSDTNICLGETINFTTTPSIGGSYNYSWSPAGIMDDATISNPSGTFMTPGTNIVSVQVDNGAGGCTKFDTLTVNVSSGFPPNIIITPNNAAICVGDSIQLDVNLGAGIPASCGPSATTTCSGAPSQQTIGTQSGQNTSTSFPAPYGNYYRNVKHQFLYTAAELNAMGIIGGKITQIAWEITQINGTTTYNDYQIKMGCTSTNNISTWENGLTSVFGSPITTHNVNIVQGWNTHTFDVAYEWDGLSNIVVEICYDNLAVTYTDNSITPWTTTSFTSSIWYRSDSQAACPETTSSGTGSDRPVTRFTSCSVSPDPNIYTYSWSPATNLSDSTIKNPLAFPSNTTTYTVTVTDTLGGCSSTASQQVDVINGFTLTPSQSATAICLGESVSFGINPNPTGSYNYTWSPAGIMNNSNVSNPTGTFTTPGLNMITVEVENGCVKSDTFYVNVSSGGQPTLSFLPNNNPTINCNDTYQITSNITNGSGATPVYIYDWIGSTTLSDTTIANPIASPTNTTTYYLTVTDSIGGCSDSESITVNVNTPFTSIYGAQDICPGGTVMLYADAGFDSYLWSTGETTDTIYTGIGSVSLTISSAGCSDFSTSTTVNANPVPTASFIATPESPSKPGIPVTFTDNSSGNDPLLNNWNFDVTGIDGVLSSLIDAGPISWTYQNQAIYTVSLTVSNTFGCSNSISEEYIISADIVPSNVVTPNGDGMNDFLVFKFLDPAIYNNKLTVFNRWGISVYEQDNYNNDWNGDDLNTGTYFYILEVDSENQNLFKGSFTILK